MNTYLFVALVILALCLFSFLRSLLRWIVFLPLAFAGAMVLNLFDFENILLTLFAAKISSTLGLIFSIAGVFMDFLVVTLIARLVCPSQKVGWGIAFLLCLIIAVYNLCQYHVYALFPFGSKGTGEPVPPIIWWHVIILVISSLMGAGAGSGGEIND